jgi:hypothetical protein
MAVFGLAAGCWDIRSVKREGWRKGKKTRGREEWRIRGLENRRIGGREN